MNVIAGDWYHDYIAKEILAQALHTLAHNFAVAGGLCAAFDLGNYYGSNPGRVEEWKPNVLGKVAT